MSREPVFNVPAAVVALLVSMVAVHGGLALLSERQQAEITLALAFIPARFAGFAAELPGGTGATVWSFLTHQFVHGDAAHLLLNSAWLLAFGGAVAQRVGNLRFMGVALLSGLAGALLFLAMRYGELVPMVGASGAVSGLMGAAFRFFFAALDRGGFEAYRHDPGAIPRQSLGAMLRDRRAVTAIAIFALINALMAFAAPLFTSAGGIAWEAHLGGFLFGLLTFAIFDPPRRALRPTQVWPPTLH